jgi:hypothetical protein
MNFHTIIEKIKNKHGIEFGGPTELFWNNQFGMPLYDNVTLDGGNLISDNHFQHKFSEKYEYSNKVGLQFDVDCAGDVSKINKKYDFVVTSHVIEHIANPIKAIKNWSKLLLNSDGYVLSIIPHYSYCFDRIRPLTTINHLISDFENNVTVSVQFGDFTKSDKGTNTAEVAVFRGDTFYIAVIGAQDLAKVESGSGIMPYCSPEVVAWVMDKAKKIK